jgi:anti-anti-sigma factor
MRIDALTVSIADAGEDFLVTCVGGLDQASASEFRSSVDAVVALHPEQIFLDCQGVTFIDSCGVGAVMHLALGCRAKGIMLTAAMNDTLRQVFEPVGISGLFSPAP